MQLTPSYEDTIAGKSSCAYRQAPLHRLDMVCKTFHHLCKTNAQLHTSLYLSKRTTSYSISKLRQWLGKHLTSICTLVTHCHSHLLEEVLTLLTGYALTRVCLANVDSHVLKLMTEFKFITHCVIQLKERGLTLSLGALPQLPHLTNLALEDGNFTNLEDAVGLTSLRLRKCMASTSDPCMFMTSLLTLQLEVATLCIYHQRGLCEFSCLQYLRCIQSRVEGRARADSLLLREEVWVPSHLSLLAALTKLGFQAHQGRNPPLSWITQLQGLKSVSARIIADVVELPQVISTMVNLQSLEILCHDKFGNRGLLLVELNWTSLVSLQSVVLSSGTIFSKSFDGLLFLKSLKHLHLSCYASIDASQLFIDLSQRMGISRPDVEFSYKLT